MCLGQTADGWHFLGGFTIMIEYKAECDHVLEARDEDAGKIVRCSICGRTSTVPRAGTPGFDNLFDKVEQQEPPTDAKRLKRRRDKRMAGPRAPRTRRPGQLDPFAIILRMCYAALLLAIVIYVGKFYVVPLLSKDGTSASPITVSDGLEPAPVRRAFSSAAGFGLIDRPDGRGLYVASVPSGAMVYCVEASKAPPRGRIRDVDGCVTGRASGGRIGVSADGRYVVEVVLPWNDPGLNSPALPYYREYLAFRRELERASEDRQRALLEAFFVPDDAWSVFAHQTDEQIYIVRQYRDVEIRNGRSKGVRALFLPWIRSNETNAINLQTLVSHYLPGEVRYYFDETQARAELEYYDVPKAQQPFVYDALAKIGLIPFVTADGKARLFKIGIEDGAFAARIVRDAGP